jgi:DtxR family transcriptional regulator, Mn-dependent transcriptional regulator
MNNHLSASIEDYLKTIYSLTQEQERASTNDIAEQMGVTPASATGIIQKLAAIDPPLVDYQKHRGVSLTAEGEHAALEIIRHHRLLESFLHDKLGYAWDEVHDEADRLEHVISEKLEERISVALGDPSFDPHGDPIPTREFQMPDWSNVRMSALRPGDRATVQRIADDDPELLRYLISIGLTLNSIVKVLALSPFDGNLQVQIIGQEKSIVLGARVTNQVFVKFE